MWRLVFGAAAVVAIAGSSEAVAQGRSWVPWQESYAPSSPSMRYEPSRRAAPAANTAERRRRATRDEADDDTGGSVFAPRGGQVAAPRSAYQYPAHLEGGARPDIAPASPPQVRVALGYAPGSIVIDTAGRSLYYVTSGTTAYRYPISVGREGFTWRGTEKISRVQAWPDWRPPAEMRQRDPKLPEIMTGGVNNPLGAKALYLGNSLYRIHGTNDSRTIGYAASSGCFRMMNNHVIHLSTLAGVGTTVHVLDRLPRTVASLN